MDSLHYILGGMAIITSIAAIVNHCRIITMQIDMSILDAENIQLQRQLKAARDGRNAAMDKLDALKRASKAINAAAINHQRSVTGIQGWQN